MSKQSQGLTCHGCRTTYPLADGAAPVLIDESKSIFNRSHLAQSSRQVAAKSLWWKRFQPKLSQNWKADANYRALAATLPPGASVLVVGGGDAGAGFAALASTPGISLVETDVYLGPRTQLICDGHELPFQDASFDAVIVQAVLEHVLDPVRCVAEIWRVLKPNGVVYSETPFMQQVHLGPYDFTRFTRSGHRWLFRNFVELDSGACCGPGMALAWGWRYFLTSLAPMKARKAMIALAALTAFWLPMLDRWLIHRPAAWDGASGFYFMGRKSQQALSGREVVAYYRGGISAGMLS